MSTKSNPKAEQPNEDCGCNMLRNSSDQRCTCKSKINDCPTFVNYKCSVCGCQCKLRCNICTTCFPHRDHFETKSHCYDCAMEEVHQREIDEDYYEDW
jgi:hypothetical protein